MRFDLCPLVSVLSMLAIRRPTKVTGCVCVCVCVCTRSERECEEEISFFKHVMQKYGCSPREKGGEHFERVKLTNIHQCVIFVFFICICMSIMPFEMMK